MMMPKCPSLLLCGSLLFAVGLRSLPVAAQAVSAPDAGKGMAPRLAALEKELDAQRVKMHVPGCALVVIKDGKVVYSGGLGLRDVERKLPVTARTLFAIGSSSKAFTATTVMMSVDEGKLSLDASPKRYLPYFKLQDPDADRRITLSDLLCHRSGLARTDLLWVSGVLSPEETIRAVAYVKPTAKLGEKFQYQNVMFLAAGQCVAAVQHTTWQRFVAQRIFAPLGMTSTETTIDAMQRAPDYALGYNYDTAKQAFTHMPMRKIDNVAPAGAINSNATDMAHWLRFLLDGGIYNGKRLVSAANFARMMQSHMKMALKTDYGYGWMLHDWQGHKVVEHGGNIDGFTAEVALMPDQHLGYALLTNANDAALGPASQEIVWKNLVAVAPTPADTAAKVPAGDPALEVGRYELTAAHLVITISLKDGKLHMEVPGQPNYTLENVGGRRYKLADPPLAGFFATFRPVKDHPDRAEVYLEQPQGNFALAKLADTPAPAVETASVSGPLKDLIGTYDNAKLHFSLDIAVKEGRVSMIVAGQPAYPLVVDKDKDHYRFDGLPETFALQARRDAAGKVIGCNLKQPQGDVDLDRHALWTPPLSVDELMAKVIAAAGGEEALSRHHSLVTHMTIDMENQGVTAQAVAYRRAPASRTIEMTMRALGKTLLTGRDYCDGTRAGSESSVAPAAIKTGAELADARLEARFAQVDIDWKTLYKSVTIERMDKVEGENAYVVKKTPMEGNPITDYISTRTFLLLRRDSLATLSNLDVTLPVSETYHDYRRIDGQMISFKRIEISPLTGHNITTVQEIKWDVPLDDAVFKAK